MKIYYIAMDCVNESYSIGQKTKRKLLKVIKQCKQMDKEI